MDEFKKYIEMILKAKQGMILQERCPHCATRLLFTIRAGDTVKAHRYEDEVVIVYDGRGFEFELGGEGNFSIEHFDEVG